MNTIFKTKFFSNNRKRLRESVDSSLPIVITAQGLLQRNADTTFPFHQDSNFWYLTGIDEPDLILVMDGAEEYVIVPGRSDSREAFDGAVDKDTLSKVSGIVIFLDEEEGWRRLGETLQETGRVQTLLPPAAYIEQYGMYTNPARSRLVERLKAWKTDAQVIDIREQLVALRMIKQPEELQALQKAIDVTIDGLLKVTDTLSLQKYTYEFEVENQLTAAFRTVEASGHAFAPIIASGKRGVTLHNVENSGTFAPNVLVIMDVGAEVSHYAADITRTVPYGTATERQEQIVAAVLEVQNYALSLLKPGTMLKDYELQIETYMGSKLQELGLIETVDHESVRKYYPHATSHFLGLDVHDVGDYSRPLEPGMVLTCEPGIYIPEEGIGARIEDDVLITADGHKILSERLPRQLSAYA
ncbi:MAG: hypothetical protein JWP13_880 [Candidatus Saccharibacteria bacterium]|nr:hypothetical protein [Candidatus Saccharibacteria bacterium]